jgi:hypothetical protein
MEMYLIYDRKAQNVQSFFTADNHVSAIRAVINAGKQAGSTLADYPQDFELRHVGTLDRFSCAIMLNEVPEILGSVDNLLAASAPKPVTPDQVRVVKKD